MAHKNGHRGQNLSIHVPPSLAQQAGGQPLFSPALPTVLQTQFRPTMPHGLPHPLSLMNPLQTPMQAQFFPPPSPFVPGHNQRGSLVGLPPHFAIPGQNMIPGVNAPLMQQNMPNNQPMGHGHGRSSSVSLPFNRNRRQGSISLGGPPKATLGGPQNKHVAAPLTNPATAAAALEKTIKGKKLVVKPPIEGPDVEGIAREFTRYPVPLDELPVFEEPGPLDVSTVEIYPEERPRDQFPRTLEVFLPGKDAWDQLKRKLIDEKLRKLGVEPSNGPPAFGHVHGRAASMSSPADHNLLMFKLNKLQQQHQAFSPNLSNSGLSVSPGPRASSTSPQPNTIPAGRFNRLGSHGHSLSLANPPHGYNTTGAFNPFGPMATLGSDQIISPSGSGRGLLPAEHSAMTPEESKLHAPRGVPGRLGALPSKIDFMRGFGLESTEETEEELEDDGGSQAGASDFAASEIAAVLQEELDAIPEVDEPPSKPGSRIHSRHVSRISAALSLRSLGRGGKSDSGILEEEDDALEVDQGARPWGSDGALRSAEDKEPAHEWSDDESVGEYSNPSDEERAREARRLRRAKKLSKEKQPFAFPQMLAVPPIPRAHELDSDDVVSNPSEEERMYQPKSTGRRPLPAIPTSATHSRNGSGQAYVHSRSPSGQLLPHAIPLPHSRAASGQYATVGSAHGTPPTTSAGLVPPSGGFAINHRDSLNPNAKPFVFGKPWNPNSAPPTAPAAAPVANVAPSSTNLNPAAPVFKPSIAAPEFKPSFVAKEFKPATSTPEVQHKLPGLEFIPSGLTSAFQSNPGSNDFKAEPIPASDFTFQLPPTAPKLTFLEPEPEPVEEPELPVNAFGRAVQGREKRLKKDEDTSLNVANPRAEIKAPTPVGADSLTWGNLSSFAFPPNGEEVVEEPEESPAAVTKPFVFPPPKKTMAAPTLPQVSFVQESPQQETLQLPTVLPQAAVESRTHETFGIARSPKPTPLNELPRRDSANMEHPISSAASSGTTSRALPQPPQRAQTMLEYKPHPASANTVPASLFKNLASVNSAATDDDAPLGLVRSHLRSKLGSREVFEHNHRPSMDDVHMPMIARKVPRTHETEVKESSPLQKVVVTTEIVTTQRASLPMPQSAESSLESDVESPLEKPDLVDTSRVDKSIDEKLESLRQDVRTLVESHLMRVNKTTSNRAEEALMRIAHLMREQAAERQAYDLTPERAQQASINSELIRNIVEDSNKEVCASVQRDLADFARHIQAGVKHSPGGDILRMVDEQTSRVVNAVSSATINLVSRLEAIQELVEQPPVIAPNHNRVPSHEALLSVLRPHLEELRTAPFDVDIVTTRLAEAVKPTLADFIDLASDKRETADLIVAKLAPVLTALRPAPIETQAIATQLAADVSRLVPPVDSHALTEQVADLVVERLDSRLAVRDRSLKPELTAQKVTEALEPLFSSNALGDIVERLTQQEKKFDRQHGQIHALEEAILRSLSGLPEKLRSTSASSVAPSSNATNVTHTVPSLTTEALKQLLVSQLEPLVNSVSTGNQGISATQASLVETAQQTQNMLDSGLSDLLHGQGTATSQLQELVTGHENVLKQLSSIPEQITATGQSLRSAQSEFLSKLRSLPDIVELQNQRMELQVQLAKARSSHGQVRSEKEVLGERVSSLETEREHLRTELQTIKMALADKDAELTNSASKATQLESALQQALSRVDTSEAVAKTLKDQIMRIESTQRELQKVSNERQVKVESLELQLSFANRDKESVQDALKRAEQERDTAAEQQQESWKESRLMSQKIDSLMQLLVAKESDELRELKRFKERSKGVEAELALAKSRVTELESRVEGLVRSEAKATQSGEDSQRQIQDYEAKLQKLEREIEPLRRLDDAQKTRDREFEQIRLQLQSQEIQEDSLRRNNMELQEEITTLRAELEIAQKAQATAKWQQHQAKEPTAPPYARAAPTLNGRSSAVSGADSSRSNTPPAAHNGVWSSIHAPSKSSKVPPGYQSVNRPSLQASGRQVTHSSNGYHRAASPAQSVVSQAPTLREDGWWE